MMQMALADEMGVSYQAVSNWERGNSMPDISKLPELCKILGISFEELVGEKNAETEITQKLMKEEDAEVTLDEMAQVGQLVNPDKLESKMNETLEKGRKISFGTLLRLAPFMDQETLGKMAEKMADTVDAGKLCAFSPFLSKESLDRIVEKNLQSGKLNKKNILSLAPFLSKSTIHKIAEYLIEHGEDDLLVGMAPFMGKETFSAQFMNMDFDMEDNNANDGASYDDEEHDLDDLDEDEVAKLAFAALEAGKNIECYLDYMDEDDIKKLLLKVAQK